jgi:hypothetical protein
MLWEIATGLISEYNVLVPIGSDLECDQIMKINGKPMQWPITPKVAPYVAPRRKRKKVRADIEYLIWGAIVLNERAYRVLHNALLPFGEFLPLDCLGERHYFYNVTTLFSVVDYENSAKMGKSVTKPVFISTATPTGFCIFKDELTAGTAIYINDETKLELEKVLAEHKLTGLFVGEAGTLLT